MQNAKVLGFRIQDYWIQSVLHIFHFAFCTLHNSASFPDFAALEKADEIAFFVNHAERADAVVAHQLRALRSKACLFRQNIRW